MANGFHQDEDAIIQLRNVLYINEELSFEYTSIVFVPYVNNIRSIILFSEQYTIIFMDSVGVHLSLSILLFFSETFVIAIVFPDHITNIFQMLDLLFFALLKILKRLNMTTCRMNC
jgi:hypothetical protein